MYHLLRLFIYVLLVALFLYSRLLPHRDRLLPKYRGAFAFFDNIFRPVLNALRSLFKPVPVGQGLSVDTAQVFLFVLLLMLLKLI